MSPLRPAEIRDRLLATPQCEDFARLPPSLERVPLRLRETVLTRDPVIEHASSVEHGLCSILADA